MTSCPILVVATGRPDIKHVVLKRGACEVTTTTNKLVELGLKVSYHCAEHKGTGLCPSCGREKLTRERART